MKNKKALIFKTLIAILVLLFAFGTWYNYTYKMEKAKQMEINPADTPNKLLIATQGSVYKDSMLQRLINHFEPQKIFIKVIDVSDLKEIKISEWTAICLMHTWEMWKPPLAVEEFVKRHPAPKNLAVVTTSGDSTYKMEEVDAITGASVIENIDADSRQLINQIERILQQNSKTI